MRETDDDTTTASAQVNYVCLGNAEIPEDQERYLILDVGEMALWLDTAHPPQDRGIIQWVVSGPMSGRAVDVMVRAAASHCQSLIIVSEAGGCSLRTNDTTAHALEAVKDLVERSSRQGGIN